MSVKEFESARNRKRKWIWNCKRRIKVKTATISPLFLYCLEIVKNGRGYVVDILGLAKATNLVAKFK